MLNSELILPGAVIITLFVLKRLIQINRFDISEGKKDDGEQTEISRKKLNLPEGVEIYEVFHPLIFISEFYRRCHRQKIKLIIVGLNARFTDVLKQSDVFNCVCYGNIVENIDEAMDLSKNCFWVRISQTIGTCTVCGVR